MLSIPIIKKCVNPIAQKYKLKKVYVFGSYAKGLEKEESDVDLLVETPSKMSIFKLSGFMLDVKEALKLPVDIVALNEISKEFDECIGDDRVLIYEEQG